MAIKNEIPVKRMLRQKGIDFKNLSDVPLRDIRHAQRGAFPDMRMAWLAPALRDQALKTPLLKDLLCTRTGFQGPSPAHYIPRPTGSYDFILIFCTGGCGWVEIDGREQTVQANEGFLIPAHTPHTYGSDPDNPWENYWVHFQGNQSGDFAKLICKDKLPAVFQLANPQEIIAGLEHLYQHMSHVHTSAMLLAASGILQQLLCSIQLRCQSSTGKMGTAEENIDKTIEFMAGNLSHRFSLKDLARQAGMSPNHYGALFKERHQDSPLNYFNRLKIQKACELLTTTDLRIHEVGELLGFQDPYYFSRLFKKTMGLSPRAYR